MNDLKEVPFVFRVLYRQVGLIKSTSVSFVPGSYHIRYLESSIHPYLVLPSEVTVCKLMKHPDHL